MRRFPKLHAALVVLTALLAPGCEEDTPTSGEAPRAVIQVTVDPNPVPPSQTPWQEIQRGIVDELAQGMVLKPAVKYQKIHATFGVPRDNH